ncbi:MAG: threonylcarbamoyl-AMP synthase [Ruminococcus sp.]|nr:threonylcarbamoyl-AMP synthase [Ruminococcus sp.]
METKILQDCATDLLEAATLLRNGNVVGIPTETVYGLAADATNSDAVRQIFAAKGRPADNPLIIHIAEIDQLYKVASDVPPLAQKLEKQFWPGPLTIILPKSPNIPSVTSGGLDTVGIRMPSHTVARALIRLSNCVLAAPSANRSGYPSPTTAEHVYRDMCGKIAAVLDGGVCDVGIESTVLTLEGENDVRILRPGAVTAEMLKKVVPNVTIDNAVLHQLENGKTAKSPGMKYQHYSPKAKITLVKGSLEHFTSWISQQQNDTGVYALVFDGEEKFISVPCLTYGIDSKEQAQQVFAKLREFDDIGANHVYVHAPIADGIGLAVYNRLIRAAGFEVIQV